MNSFEFVDSQYNIKWYNLRRQEFKNKDEKVMNDKSLGMLALVLCIVLCVTAENGTVLRNESAGTSGVRLAAADIPFVPATAPKSQVSAKLNVLERKNMPFVEATLDGRKCNLLFDTGATHTTFDVGFIRRELSDRKLDNVMLVGTSNVKGAPKVFQVSSLKIGDAEFGHFTSMALDMSHLVQGIGVKVDGIVGMNVIGRVPTFVSLGSGRVVFVPGPDVRRGFGKGILRSVENPFSVALSPSFRGKRFPIIVDSASSLTFLSKSIGWPSSKKSVDIGAVEVNGNSAFSTETGLNGMLHLGEDVEIKPMLVDEPVSRIGADTLLEYDMLVDDVQVRFRRRVTDR